MSDRRFDDFYVFDYPRLVAAVRLITGSVDAARDAVDEACARAWERVERGDDIEVLGAWIRVVAINVARGGIRRRASERRAVYWLTATAERNATEPYGARETAIDIHRLLAALPRRQREVVVLHYLLDQSVAAIATELHIAEGTVKAALNRARHTLADALETQRARS
ncbi:MAG TPA: RNA polymerase sigma factor [Acidimicrobiia bacterium]|nr:RNA polymerase sigma factor [Acidimicrobiia bacterium]